MGLTGQLWPVSDAELEGFARAPASIDAAFHAARRDAHGYVLLHGARPLLALLKANAGRAGADLTRIPRASDPSYALTAAGVRSLVGLPADEPWRSLLALRAECVNGLQLSDIAARAAALGQGLLFVVFEDY
jgi:hypothetical protein